MALDPDLLTDVLERLAPLGAVTSRRMFGGAGIFIDGQMFAKLSPSGVVAFKADDENAPRFAAAGMTRAGKMPYWDATAEQMEDDDALRLAAGLACDAARRA